MRAWICGMNRTASESWGNFGLSPPDIRSATLVSLSSPPNGSSPVYAPTATIPKAKMSAGFVSTGAWPSSGLIISGAIHPVFPTVGETAVKLELVLMAASP